MGVLEQHPFDLPDIGFGQPPVVIAQDPQIDHGVAGDAAGEVDVRLDIAERQRPRRGEHGKAPVQSGIPRSRHRSPALLLLIDEQHVIEQVGRFEAEDQRRVPVLLEDRGGEQRGLEAMRTAVANDAAEAAERGSPAGLLVVRQAIQVPLHGKR